MARVGFIGLGTMGSAIARRLLEHGHDVTVWNRSPSAVRSLLLAGAKEAAAPADALETGIAFSMLANDLAVDAVFDDETLARTAGAVHVNMATVSVESARTLQARHERAGVEYAAAPVLGRPHLAESGQLNVVAAGSAAALGRAEAFFPAFSKRVWVLGECAARANLVKIGVNYNLIHTMQALAESINLVELGGLAGSTFVDILTDAAYTGTAYGSYGPRIAAREYTPVAFDVGLGVKDLSLARSAAKSSGAALPTASVLAEIFEATLADPQLARLDWSAMAEITRRRSSGT